MSNQFRYLPRNSNQAKSLGEYAIDFCRSGDPSPSVRKRVALFHTDGVACAISALAAGTNAPTILRQEALRYSHTSGATCFGSPRAVQPEKAVLANCSAVREWDANGTNFGYDPDRGNVAGEFGHNDYYAVVMAAAQQRNLDGATALLGMVCLDEIRGRLAEVFSLKTHKIDHVLHGGIASVAVYGALMGANAHQIESAIGLLVAHHVPFRAIRAGHQLSDSKGASAAITAEMAVVAVHRSMAGFVGPSDIVRNPQALFCLFNRPARAGDSPFDLHLAMQGDEFAVMGMHFKLGIYEHQSAGAIQALLDLLRDHPQILAEVDRIERIQVTIYEPAFGIIGDPAKRDPQTRQSADHSLVYIVATVLRKAMKLPDTNQIGWAELMLLPDDYQPHCLFDPQTRRLMEMIKLRHGGPDYDSRYPDGIPTTVAIDVVGNSYSSGLVMYPEGHARSDSSQLNDLLRIKFRRFAGLATNDEEGLHRRLAAIETASAKQLRTLYSDEILHAPHIDSVDGK